MLKNNGTEESKTPSGSNANEDAAVKKESFFKSTAFILIVAIAAFIGMLVLVFSAALGGGLSFKNLAGKERKNVNFREDSLSEYIDIKESDYKEIEIILSSSAPTADDVEAEIQRLIATHRKGPVDTTQTWFYNRPLKIGDDALIYYVAYTLDKDGRKLTVKEASNHKTAEPYRYTIGTGADVFGSEFDSALVGKYAVEGEGIGNIRDTAYVTDGCVIYATVSYVMDNGLLYDSIDVCIDPSAPDFEEKWGRGAADLFCGYDSKYQKMIGSILLTGGDTETFILPDERTITYTAATVNYVTHSNTAPITIESTLPYNYAVEELRGKEVFFDVYLEKTVAYDIYEFDEDFVTNKIGYPDVKYNAETFAKYEGSTATEKYRSYIREVLNISYENYKRSYAEQYIWNYIKTHVAVKKYPETEVDNVYLSWEKYYKQEFAKAQGAGAGYENFDEYMAEIFELGEGGEWTSVLLANSKDTVKERLLTYAILRDANLLPSEEEFKKIFDEELLRDFNYANSISQGKFETLEDYKKYIENDRGLSEYEHDVYYYYVTDKLVEMNFPN